MFQTDLTKLHKVTLPYGVDDESLLKRKIRKWFRKSHIVEVNRGFTHRPDYVVQFYSGTKAQFFFSNPEQAMIFKLSFA